MTKCGFPHCRQPSDLIYIRWPLCTGHWERHGEDYDVRVKLGPPIEDFKERVDALQDLLTRGNDATVRKYGSQFSGKINLFRYGPYLKDRAARRLPGHWRDIGVITAKCHTDDWVSKVDFDAASWFERATDEEITELAKCDWGGNYAADQVALGLQDELEALRHLFTYLQSVNDVGKTIGFECHVDPREALLWLEEHKPNLHTEITALVGEG